jgi:DNA-binding NtrC family response regulator
MDPTGAERSPATTARGNPALAVLLVAVDSRVLAVTRRLLERLGFETRVADDAGAVARCLRAGGPVAGAVLDLGVPEIDAESAFSALRRQLPELPVLLIGGFAEDALAARLMDANATDFLAKPFGLDALGAKAAALFAPGHPRPQRQSAGAGARPPDAPA